MKSPDAGMNTNRLPARTPGIDNGRITLVKLRLFDESFARDFPKWKQTWDQTGILATEIARPEQNIRDFFYFKKRDPVTGVVGRRPKEQT